MFFTLNAILFALILVVYLFIRKGDKAVRYFTLFCAFVYLILNLVMLFAFESLDGSLLNFSFVADKILFVPLSFSLTKMTVFCLPLLSLGLVSYIYTEKCPTLYGQINKFKLAFFIYQVSVFLFCANTLITFLTFLIVLMFLILSFIWNNQNQVRSLAKIIIIVIFGLMGLLNYILLVGYRAAQSLQTIAQEHLAVEKIIATKFEHEILFWIPFIALLSFSSLIPWATLISKIFKDKYQSQIFTMLIPTIAIVLWFERFEVGSFNTTLSSHSMYIIAYLLVMSMYQVVKIRSTNDLIKVSTAINSVISSSVIALCFIKGNNQAIIFSGIIFLTLNLIMMNLYITLTERLVGSTSIVTLIYNPKCTRLIKRFYLVMFMFIAGIPCSVGFKFFFNYCYVLFRNNQFQGIGFVLIWLLLLLSVGSKIKKLFVINFPKKDEVKTNHFFLLAIVGLVIYLSLIVGLFGNFSTVSWL